MPNFVAVTVETSNNKLVYIGTSAGRYLYEHKGIDSKAAIDFLFNLRTLGKRKTSKTKRPVFIWYAALRDVELLLRGLPWKEKNKAFPSERVAKAHKQRLTAVQKLKVEFRGLTDKDGPDAKYIGRQLAVLRSEIKSLTNINFLTYRIQLRQGKTLSIYKAGSKGNGITIYDVYPFFRKPLPEVAIEYLGECPPALNRDPDTPELPLWKGRNFPALRLKAVTEYVQAETGIIVRVAQELDKRLQAVGIKLNRWYGASAITNQLLTNWNVRKQFWQRSQENTPHTLWHAINSSYFGGRVESLKVGTVYNTHVYDLNGAYAYAASLLSQANKRWQYVKVYNPEEMLAIWQVKYELPDSAYLGILPHRTGSDVVIYRKKGWGWYYAPEVRTLLRMYPDSLRIRRGYVMPYEAVTFASDIERMYEHRVKLQEQGDPAEDLFKLVLASIYGKFAQTVGLAQFHSRVWAGWITSLIRAMLLEACAGSEHKVICFAQDAVHATGPLNLPLSNKLGDWKLNRYERSVYLQSGIYKHYGSDKPAKMRGLTFIDFEKAVHDLNRGWPVEARREYFVGWRLAQQLIEDRHNVRKTSRHWREIKELMPGTYLERVVQKIKLDPLVATHRVFPQARDRNERLIFNIDWSKQYVDSSIITYDDGRESAERKDREHTRRLDMMLDVVNARRY